ncbi:MAG: hypothetical protein OEW99_14805, partial [Gammaproteobacteria bacterium]|nr:hypothetical protein [Gammaproteobacteria bacterium]
KNKTLKVRYGNRYVTSLKPQYFDYDYDLNSITIEVDGINKEINIGDKIYVEKSFRVLADNNYRVNVIGFAKHGVTSENDLLIERKNIEPRFSVDRNEKIFRVELYNGKKFSGMILVNFIDENKNHPVSMNSATPNQMSSKL